MVDDYADVLIYASGPKAAVPGSLNSVHPETGTRWIGLQIEHGCLDCGLLARAQPRQAGSKCGGNSELHRRQRTLFSASHLCT